VLTEEDVGDACNSVSVELNDEEFTVKVIDAERLQARMFNLSSSSS